MSVPSSAPPEPALLGTWKLKSIESASQAGIPLPLQAVTTFVQQPDGIRYTNESLYSGGQKRQAECTFQLDGRPYSLKGSILGNAWSARRAGPHTYEAIITRDGEVSARATATISEDGRVMTTKWEIIPAVGPTIAYVSLAERQV